MLYIGAQAKVRKCHNTDSRGHKISRTHKNIFKPINWLALLVCLREQWRASRNFVALGLSANQGCPFLEPCQRSARGHGHVTMVEVLCPTCCTFLYSLRVPPPPPGISQISRLLSIPPKTQPKRFVSALYQPEHPSGLTMSTLQIEANHILY